MFGISRKTRNEAGRRDAEAASLLSDTITLLFTGIEGSTRHWEHLPEQMAVALARHDAIMRSAIAARNGTVFKTIGDAFCAAFHAPDDGLQAALAAQRALAAEDWGEIGHVRADGAPHRRRAAPRQRLLRTPRSIALTTRPVLPSTPA